MSVKPELVQRTLDIVIGNGDTSGFFEPIVFDQQGGDAGGSSGEGHEPLQVSPSNGDGVAVFQKRLFSLMPC